MTIIGQSNGKILEYENMFRVGNEGVVCKVKMKVTQPMIQNKRPVNWPIENTRKLQMR